LVPVLEKVITKILLTERTESKNQLDKIGEAAHLEKEGEKPKDSR